jgi:hypothetical protein
VRFCNTLLLAVPLEGGSAGEVDGMGDEGESYGLSVHVKACEKPHDRTSDSASLRGLGCGDIACLAQVLYRRDYEQGGIQC